MSSKPRFAPHHGEPFLVSASDDFLNSVPDTETPESILVEREEAMREELSRVLARLPDKESEALSLWISGLTQQEIADRDGITQAAVSIRAKRGIEKLFAMRDAGSLATLKNIWDGFDIIKGELAHVAEVERAADSSVDLGSQVGELPEILDLTDKEIRVFAALESGPKHLNEIKRLCWPDEERGYSWVRNALRKLVKFDMVSKTGKGRYEQVET